MSADADRGLMAAFAATVVLTRREVFEALEMCACAERALLRGGRPAEAAGVAALFELLEDRLVLDPLPQRSPATAQPAGSASCPEPSGSNSRESEFTQ